MNELGFIPYNQSLTVFAKENRNNPTKAEGLFWNLVLKGKACRGYKFRRQKVIGHFILDFYCSQLLLGIELDGGYHTTKDQAEYDKYREEIIKDYGIKILRFKNEYVENNLKGVISELENCIISRELEINKIKKFTPG